MNRHRVTTTITITAEGDTFLGLDDAVAQQQGGMTSWVESEGLAAEGATEGLTVTHTVVTTGEEVTA